MSWIRIDDGFAEHLKIADAGPIAVWVQIQALCYCGRNLTDGFIPPNMAEFFGKNNTQHIGIARGGVPGMVEFGDDADEMDWPSIMVEKGLWDIVDGGYQIHDYLDYNPSRAEVKADRRRWKEKKKKQRESQRESKGESPGDK